MTARWILARIDVLILLSLLVLIVTPKVKVPDRFVKSGLNLAVNQLILDQFSTILHSLTDYIQNNP